jgi:hypothetical protein
MTTKVGRRGEVETRRSSLVSPSGLWLGGWRSVLAGSWANKMGLSCACPPYVSRVRAGKSASGKAS